MLKSKLPFRWVRGDETTEERYKKMSPSDRTLMDHMLTITHVISKMLYILSFAPNEMKKDFCRKLYGVKENMDNLFPMTLDGGEEITELCPLCITNKDDDPPCPHNTHLRAALLLMAQFRFHPEFDLDVTEGEEEEIPDPNEGMVKA